MHDFEIINQYRDIYLALLKKHSQYSLESSCWKNEISGCSVAVDQDFASFFPYKKYIGLTDELEKIKKVLRWVNENLMYPRQEECAYPLSATRIMKHVREKRVTVNCLSHAMVLNECLHYAGIVSRIIFCLPIDIHPRENHVMVHAYSAQRSKWIALDPSWNCYYCDSSGEIMSLPEIRRAIVNDLPFSIQYNHRMITGSQSSSYKPYFVWENIYSYLCKNFFRFSGLCEVDGKVMIQYELLPASVLDKEIEIIDQSVEPAFIRRFVSNEAEFWAAPTIV